MIPLCWSFISPHKFSLISVFTNIFTTSMETLKVISTYKHSPRFFPISLRACSNQNCTFSPRSQTYIGELFILSTVGSKIGVQLLSMKWVDSILETLFKAKLTFSNLLKKNEATSYKYLEIWKWVYVSPHSFFIHFYISFSLK